MLLFGRSRTRRRTCDGTTSDVQQNESETSQVSHEMRLSSVPYQYIILVGTGPAQFESNTDTNSYHTCCQSRLGTQHVDSPTLTVEGVVALSGISKKYCTTHRKRGVQADC